MIWHLCGIIRFVFCFSVVVFFFYYKEQKFICIACFIHYSCWEKTAYSCFIFSYVSVLYCILVCVCTVYFSMSSGHTLICVSVILSLVDACLCGFSIGLEGQPTLFTALYRAPWVQSEHNEEQTGSKLHSLHFTDYTATDITLHSDTPEA